MDTVKINPPMPDANQCPQCGTPLPAGALAGLCPACLLKMGAAADTITDAKQNLSRRQAQAKVALVTAELAQRRHRPARVHGSLGRAPGKAAVSGSKPPGRVTVRMRYTLGPLADVAKFIVGTRPIRTMEWTNVVLPK